MAVVSVSLCGSGVAAIADTGNDNILKRLGADAENILIVEQSGSGGHSASIQIDSTDTLLSGGRWQRNTSSILEPGTVFQRGTDHILSLSAKGEENQVAISQSGSTQYAIVAVQGAHNIASVMQAGFNNSASVTQSGSHNTVVISQY